MRQLFRISLISLCGLAATACDLPKDPKVEGVQAVAPSSSPNGLTPKEPGCETLIGLGQLEDMERLELGSITIEEAQKKYINIIDFSESTQLLRNTNTINFCNLYQFHLKDVPDNNAGYKQVIFTFLEDKDQSSNVLTAGGVKVTCWSDTQEKWHAKSKCD